MATGYVVVRVGVVGGRIDYGMKNNNRFPEKSGLDENQSFQIVRHGGFVFWIERQSRIQKRLAFVELPHPEHGTCHVVVQQMIFFIQFYRLFQKNHRLFESPEFVEGISDIIETGAVFRIPFQRFRKKFDGFPISFQFHETVSLVKIDFVFGIYLQYRIERPNRLNVISFSRLRPSLVVERIGKNRIELDSFFEILQCRFIVS